MSSPAPLDIRHFARLLSGVAPGSQLWLYSAGGEFIWLQDGPASAPASLDLSGWQRGAGDLQWHEEDAGCHRAAWPVRDEQEAIGHYFVVTAASSFTPDEFYLRACPVLEAASQALAHELYMSKQLNSMARELAVRYDELNLVYFTDDEVRYLDEGRKALHLLVQNCNDYLDVDAAILTLPEHGIWIARGYDDPAASDPLMGTLRERVVGILGMKARTIVLNEPAETEDVIGIRAKTIASPLLDGAGQIAGALAIVRNENGRDFENSDRNLLLVMAGKASKIVQSSYDALTGLMRQDAFERNLSAAFARARRGDQQHALLHVNVDRMHLINDTLGYQCGDRVLKAVSALLRGRLRANDCIARLGGDDFGILLHNCTISQAGIVAEKLCTAVAAHKVETEGEVLDVTACIGVSPLTKDCGSTIDAQAGAEIACAVAKERGRNRWHLYSERDPALKSRRQHMEWVGRLKEALQHGQFVLYSQRIMPLHEAIEGYHFEVLVRMLDDKGAIVPPMMFLPVAERYQMMPAVDRWIVENTLASLATHSGRMLAGKIGCSLNLSGQTLVDETFAEFVEQQLERHGVAPSLICFEITETAAISNLEDAQRLISAIKALGCNFALDDFGAGLSSFAYLRALPVDYLKLDGSFVKPILEDETAAAMLAAMNQIGQIVGLRTVAEFVESEPMMAMLRGMGIDYAQGYGVAKPRPLAEELAQLAQPEPDPVSA